MQTKTENIESKGFKMTECKTKIRQRQELVAPWPEFRGPRRDGGSNTNEQAGLAQAIAR